MSHSSSRNARQTQTDLDATAGGPGLRRNMRGRQQTHGDGEPALAPADGESLYDTAEYLQLALEKARSEIRSLGTAAAEERPALSTSAASTSEALSLAMRSPQMQRVVGRLCDAERNLSIERDRYARLLARNAQAMHERADDAQRIRRLQALVFEYEKLIALQRAKLEEATDLTNRLSQLGEAREDVVSAGGRQAGASRAEDRPPRLDTEALLDELYARRNALRESMSHAKHMLLEVDSTIVRLRNSAATIDQV